MMRRSIAGLAALGLCLACSPAPAGNQAARQADEDTGQEQAIGRLDAIRRVGHLIDAEVGGAGGAEGIARVRDVVWDGRGRALYFLLSPGLGEAVPVFIPVPARVATLARVEEEGWLMQLDAEGDRIEAVPRLGVDEVDALRDPGRRAAIEDQFAPEEDPAPIEPGDEPDPELVRASELLGRPVACNGGAVVRVEDILLGNDHRASYAVLAVEGDPERLVPVPFSALSIRRGKGGAVEARLDEGRDQLADAPSLEGDWLRMLNDSFVQAVNNVHSEPDDRPKP